MTWKPLLALCEGRLQFTDCPHNGPVTKSFDVFFVLMPKKPLNKQEISWRFETPWSELLWNLRGTSVGVLPRCLLNFIMIGQCVHACWDTSLLGEWSQNTWNQAKLWPWKSLIIHIICIISGNLGYIYLHGCHNMRSDKGINRKQMSCQTDNLVITRGRECCWIDSLSAFQWG